MSCKLCLTELLPVALADGGMSEGVRGGEQHSAGEWNTPLYTQQEKEEEGRSTRLPEGGVLYTLSLFLSLCYLL